MLTRRAMGGGIWALFVPTIAACLTTTDFDRLQSGPRPGADGSSEEGVADASDGASPLLDGGDTPAGTLLLAESYEEAGPTSCIPYYPWQGTAKAGTPAHRGARACLVCRARSGTGPFTLDGIVAPSPPEGGERYVGEVWVRAPETGPSAPSITLTLRLKDSADDDLGTKASAEVALDTTWRRVTVDWTLPRSGHLLNMFAASTAPEGACFLIDDAALRRVP